MTTNADRQESEEIRCNDRIARIAATVKLCSALTVLAMLAWLGVTTEPLSPANPAAAFSATTAGGDVGLNRAERENLRAYEDYRARVESLRNAREAAAIVHHPAGTSREGWQGTRADLLPREIN